MQAPGLQDRLVDRLYGAVKLAVFDVAWEGYEPAHGACAAVEAWTARELTQFLACDRPTDDWELQSARVRVGSAGWSGLLWERAGGNELAIIEFSFAPLTERRARARVLRRAGLERFGDRLVAVHVREVAPPSGTVAVAR